MLPPYTPLPADVPPENYAANLGIHYQLIARDGDTFGVRLSRTAFGNTPAAAIQLELGDMIIRLDGQSIHKPEDVRTISTKPHRICQHPHGQGRNPSRSAPRPGCSVVFGVAGASRVERKLG